MRRCSYKQLLGVSLVVLLTLGGALSRTLGAAAATGSVFSLVMNDPRFTTTMQMLFMTGYVNVGNGSNVLTVFAPTEAAWGAGNYGGMLSSLSSNSATTEFPNPSEIVTILRGVAVAGLVQPQDATATKLILTSFAGHAIEFDREAMTVSWIGHNGKSKTTKISGAPMLAVNGIVYPVDAVVGQ